MGAETGTNNFVFVHDITANGAAAVPRDDNNIAPREGEEDDDLLLPFAIVPTLGAEDETCTKEVTMTSEQGPSCSPSRLVYKQQQSLPGLESSVVSAPTDGESQASYSTQMNSSSAFDSHYLDTAASLLASAASSRLLFFGRGDSAVIPSISAAVAIPSNSTDHRSSSEGVSQLLRAADDPPQNQELAESSEQQQQQKLHQSTSRLPVLHEEQSIVSTSSCSSPDSAYIANRRGMATVTTNIIGTRDYNDSATNRSSRLPVSNIHFVSNPVFHTLADGSTTILPGATPLAASTIARCVQHSPSVSGAVSPSRIQQSRRLASLAGATSVRTGNRSFQVTIDVSARTVQDVMDIIGNPELLRLWCDPIMTGAPLVVTKSSEGARTSWNWRNGSPVAAAAGSDDVTSQQRREYEGEWIDATTMAPVIEPPSSATSVIGCFHRTVQLISSILGCPQYGKVSMFVERQKGQVSLTIGTFAGGIEVHHKVRLIPLDQQISCAGVGGRVRIIDDVRLRREESPSSADGTLSSSSPLLCCGVVRSMLEQCCLPDVDDYVDQVLSSMARLRFLVENGASAELDPGMRNSSCNEEYYYDAAHQHYEHATNYRHEQLATPLLQQSC